MNKSARKGLRTEQSLVRKLKEAGIKAVRSPGSDGRNLGLHSQVDVLADGVRIQVKSVKAIREEVRPTSAVDINIIKPDRKGFLICMWLPNNPTETTKLFDMLSEIYKDNGISTYNARLYDSKEDDADGHESNL